MSEKKRKQPKEMTSQERDAEIARITDGTEFVTYRGRIAVFHPLTVPQANVVQQAYSKKLMELTMAGDLPNASMVDAIVLKKAKMMGLDTRLLDASVQQKWFKRLFDVIPELFDEAVDQTEKQKKLREKAKDLSERFTVEEIEELVQLNAILGLKNELMANTVEVQARAYGLKYEILLATRTEDGEPFWGSMEELEQEPDAEFASIVSAYQQYKKGRGADFLLNWLQAGSGNESGSSPEETPRKSSKGRPSSGRKSKRS